MIANLTDAALLVSGSMELLLIAKATLLLLICLAVTELARTARASLRHLLIASSFAALLALPVLLLAGAPTIDVELESTTGPAGNSAGVVTPAVSVAADDVVVRASASLPQWTVAHWLRAAWAAGAIVFLIPIGGVLWRVSMIRRTGLPVEWHRAELSRLASARGVSRAVELLGHEAVPGPMTFGVTRPVIVLPLDARDWSATEVRCALMHEIEHIQRGDWLMQIMARTVAALYWFHPLVWSAWRRLCLEAERSCDDAVAMSEERTDYAEQLVTLAERMSATPAQPMLGMANRSDLSTRITALLDERVQRGRAGFALAAGTVAAAALIVMSVAPLRAIAKPESPGAVTANGQAPMQRVSGQRASRALDRELYEAANSGDFEGVKELLEAGANPSATIDGDGNPLIGAARSDRADIAKLLLDQGADPNGAVAGDGSPLINAAARGRLDQVRMLIERGADVNLAVDGDENPLMNAAEGGHLAVVELLISKGADIHARILNDRYDGRDEWRTALSQARKNGHTAVVKYLEALGAR